MSSGCFFPTGGSHGCHFDKKEDFLPLKDRFFPTAEKNPLLL